MTKKQLLNLGWFLPVILVIAWSQLDLATGATVIFVLSGITTLWFSFGTPLWCGAMTRKKEHCRKNTYGVLMGCSYNQHRWQKLKLVLIPPMWKRLTSDLFTSPKQTLSTLGAFAGLVSTVAAGIAKVVAAP